MHRGRDAISIARRSQRRISRQGRGDGVGIAGIDGREEVRDVSCRHGTISIT
jgi:hypothetical protein